MVDSALKQLGVLKEEEKRFITTKSNESEAIVKVFFENNILENTSVFSFMFRIDTHDKLDEWFEYY